MGFFGSIDRATLDKAFAAPEPETLPFGEGFDAVRESTFLTDRTDSLAYQAQDAASRSLARLRDLGVDVPEFPSWTWSNRQTKAALAVLDQKAADVAALRSPESGPPDPFLKTGAEIQKEAEERVAQARAKASRAGFFAQLAGGMAGQVTDELNLLLLPFGVARAEGAIGKMVIEAAVGAASQTAVEAASLEAKDFAGVTPTTGEVLGNIALTGAFGAGLAGLFHGAGVVARRAGLLSEYRRKVASGEVTPTRELDAAADSLQDAIDTIPPRATPEAEAAHLDAVAAATDALRAEHPIEQAAALRRVQEADARIQQSEATAPEVREPGVFYHGSGTAGLVAESLDSSMTKVDNLFGEGVYLTDSRSTAEGYARARSKKTGTPVVYRVELGDVNLVDLDTRGGDDVRAIFTDFARSLDEEFGGVLDAVTPEIEKADGTIGGIYRAMSEEISAISHAEGIPDYEMGEMLQFGLIDPLRRAGYDGFKHVGGARTGNAPHNVAIIFDPKDLGNVGRRPEFKSFAESAPPVAPRAASSAERAAIDAEIEAEAANPLPPVTDEPVALDGPPTDYATPETLAAFEQHIAESPDAPGAYIAEDGNLKAGTARELVASLAEEERELRDILNCVLTPGGAD